jgi:hypothetical protein
MQFRVNNQVSLAESGSISDEFAEIRIDEETHQWNRLYRSVMQIAVFWLESAPDHQFFTEIEPEQLERFWKYRHYDIL